MTVRPDYRDRRIWLKDEVCDFFICNAATLDRYLELGICAPKIEHTNKWDAHAIHARLDERAGIARKSDPAASEEDELLRRAEEWHTN